MEARGGWHHRNRSGRFRMIQPWICLGGWTLFLICPLGIANGALRGTGRAIAAGNEGMLRSAWSSARRMNIDQRSYGGVVSLASVWGLIVCIPLSPSLGCGALVEIVIGRRRRTAGSEGFACRDSQYNMPEDNVRAVESIDQRFSRDVRGCHTKRRAGE